MKIKKVIILTLICLLTILLLGCSSSKETYTGTVLISNYSSPSGFGGSGFTETYFADGNHISFVGNVKLMPYKTYTLTYAQNRHYIQGFKDLISLTEVNREE